jgi:hypothetical protein
MSEQVNTNSGATLCGDWSAVHDFQPAGPPTLRVDGAVCFPRTGWSAWIEAHDGPQGINPEILIVDLVVAKQGPVHAPAQTKVPVRYELETTFGYKQVHVMSRTDPSLSILLDVQIVS